jgi:hypothetical protein
MVFEVITFKPFRAGEGALRHAGCDVLEIDATGLRIRPEGEPGSFFRQPVRIKWDELTAIGDDLRAGLCFRASFRKPGEEEEITICIKLKNPEDARRLAGVLAGLEERRDLSSGIRCSDRARKTRHRPRRLDRRSGAGSILGGTFSMMLGLAVTAVSYKSSIDGESFLVSYGLIVLGLFAIVRGLFNLILQPRLSD